VSELLYAQQRPNHYTDSLGALYWRKSTPVYLFVSDSPNGDTEQLTSKSTPEYANPFYLDTEGVNYVRTREAVDPVTKKVIPNSEVMYEIYADGIAPQTSIHYEKVSKHVSAEKTFYQSGLKVSFSSTDIVSGVSKLQYEINGAGLKPYAGSIPFDTDGEFSISYFSEDKVGNVEEKQQVTFIVDSESPDSDLNINGITDDNAISKTSKMYILAKLI